MSFVMERTSGSVIMNVIPNRRQEEIPIFSLNASWNSWASQIVMAGTLQSYQKRLTTKPNIHPATPRTNIGLLIVLSFHDPLPERHNSIPSTRSTTMGSPSAGWNSVTSRRVNVLSPRLRRLWVTVCASIKNGWPVNEAPNAIPRTVHTVSAIPSLYLRAIKKQMMGNANMYQRQWIQVAVAIRRVNAHNAGKEERFNWSRGQRNPRTAITNIVKI